MYSGDMLVNLTGIEEKEAPEGIKIKRAFPGDMYKILDFVCENFGEGWKGEAAYALMQQPPKCWIAVKDGKVIGFACHDASAKDFFGPTGVSKDMRGRGIGEALLRRTLISMREEGYAYAIIGWVGDAAEFYEKAVGAKYIDGGEPQNSVYRNMIRM